MSAAGVTPTLGFGMWRQSFNQTRPGAAVRRSPLTPLRCVWQPIRWPRRGWRVRRPTPFGRAPRGDERGGRQALSWYSLGRQARGGRRGGTRRHQYLTERSGRIRQVPERRLTSVGPPPSVVVPSRGPRTEENADIHQDAADLCGFARRSPCVCLWGQRRPVESGRRAGSSERRLGDLGDLGGDHLGRRWRGRANGGHMHSGHAVRRHGGAW